MAGQWLDGPTRPRGRPGHNGGNRDEDPPDSKEIGCHPSHLPPRQVLPSQNVPLSGAPAAERSQHPVHDVLDVHDVSPPGKARHDGPTPHPIRELAAPETPTVRSLDRA